MNNILATTFLLVATKLGANASCHMPQIIYDSDMVVKSCGNFTDISPYTHKHYIAESCYAKRTKQVILPDSCAEEMDDYCLRLLKHEFAWHVEVTCLGKTFTETEPKVITDAEDFE